MSHFGTKQEHIIRATQTRYQDFLANRGISVQMRNDFDEYVTVRRHNGETHLNQAFDPRHVKIGADDFWLLAENASGEAIATYCLRRFLVEDFFDLIRSQTLWFSAPRRGDDRRFVVECAIPAFGGEVVHGGGLWIRHDYRGCSRLAAVMPHLARALALCIRPFDHDSAMIRNDPEDPPETVERKAIYMGRKVYGFARVHRFVDGWFPPERRKAVMHLCHSTTSEAVASLLTARVTEQRLQHIDEFRQRSLVDQHYQPVYPAAVLSQGQQQP